MTKPLFCGEIPCAGSTPDATPGAASAPRNNIKTADPLPDKKSAKKTFRAAKRWLKRTYKNRKRALKTAPKSKERSAALHNAKADLRREKRQAKAEYKEEKRNFSARRKQAASAARAAKIDLKRQECIEKQALLAPAIEEKRRKKAARSEQRKARREKARKVNAPPVLTPLEEIGNAVTHGVGALLSVAATVLMLLRSHTAAEVIAALVYGLSLTFLFLMSCLYHAFKKGSTVKRIWRRFDYSSIYLLIGGTFAPLFLVDLGGKIGTICFILQWVLIAVGITFVGVFGPGRLRWLHFPLYFVLGWSGLMLVPHWLSACPALFWWILAGGLAYSFGMIPFVLRGKRAAHFIWHFFVLLGAALQWIGIYAYVFCW